MGRRGSRSNTMENIASRESHLAGLDAGAQLAGPGVVIVPGGVDDGEAATPAQCRSLSTSAEREKLQNACGNG